LLEKQIKMFNKKLGQIGKTITWVVATVIIIMILIVSIFVATSYLGGSKKADFSKQTDILASKSFFAYLLTEDESSTVYEQLKEDGGENLNEFNGNLALKIFKEFYEEDYPVAIWLGIDFEGLGLPRTNKYFGSRPTSLRGGDIMQRRIDFVLEEAILNDDKWLELILMNK